MAFGAASQKGAPGDLREAQPDRNNKCRPNLPPLPQTRRGKIFTKQGSVARCEHDFCANLHDRFAHRKTRKIRSRKTKKYSLGSAGGASKMTTLLNFPPRGWGVHFGTLFTHTKHTCTRTHTTRLGSQARTKILSLLQAEGGGDGAAFLRAR